MQNERSAMKKTFVGIGFGPIQAGLFIYEAYSSGKFERYVVAEVMPDVVKAVRAGGGICRINIAGQNGVEARTIDKIEIYNPREAADRATLVDAVAGADEIATALPSVSVYKAGGGQSVAALLADGLKRRIAAGSGKRSVIYAAENHNHAAEILEEDLRGFLGGAAAEAMGLAQCLNTVIGKMSGVVADETQIREQVLARAAGDSGRCFLVEKFNRILISKVRWPDFKRGITVFEEKPDLLPFEEAKLYGHNATHALIGYLARRKKYRFISDAAGDKALINLARQAFIRESGGALCQKHKGLDSLFTPAGYAAYADDLLIRMLNPHLRDAVERVVRDPRRKLGWDDRLIGTMRLALRENIQPCLYAKGARAALEMLSEAEKNDGNNILDEIWAGSPAGADEKEKVKKIIASSVLD